MAKTALMKNTKLMFRKNSPTIFTVSAVVGLSATTVLASRASFQASDALRLEMEKRAEESQHKQEEPEEMDWKEKVQHVWPLYIPAASVGVATIASIILLNRAGSQQTAAATALYAVTDRAFTDYKNKVVETIGEKKETALRDDIAQENVTKNPPVDREVIITGSGNVLFYDTLTGRYFNSDVESVRKAQNDINQVVVRDMYASLSEFYDLIGLEPTALSDDVGWNVDALMALSFSTVLAEDGRPCISMDFEVAPIKGFNRLV